jgi:peptidyl-prolyl cis-trans isomerase C
MVNLLNRIEKPETRHVHAPTDSYSGYQEPDTTVPARAKPLFNKVSVNGVEIPEHVILSEAQNHPAENPGAALLAAAKALAVRQLLLGRAEELGLANEPLCDDEGRLETAEDAAIRGVIEAEVTVPQATVEECRRFYDNNRQRFSSEPLWEARHILVSADPSDVSAREAARASAELLIGLIKEDPASFGSIAAEYSACPSSRHGGNLGQLTRGSMVGEFEAALERLGEGELTSVPIETRYGFHIIRLDRKIEGRELPFDMVRERIAGWLEAATWSKAVSQYIALLAADAVITGVALTGNESLAVQ